MPVDRLDPRGAANFLEILSSRASAQPHRPCYRFLGDKGAEQTLTYAELEQRVRALAAELQSRAQEGQRVLVLLPPGLDYIIGFFACLYSGMIAVPAYPPRKQNASTLEAIAADSGAAVVLSNGPTRSRTGALLGEGSCLRDLQWLSTDTDIPVQTAREWRSPSLRPESIAYLQYTSGSTATPRGVMLTYANLLYNAATILDACKHAEDSVCVSWLPPYHDMGLVTAILQPMYGGFESILMSPASFLREPASWLRAISRYRGTHSGAPNFAYDVCTRLGSRADHSDLDLTGWKFAFTGAEPIRAETLERFACAFEPVGFRREAFVPAYGLAEATLVISMDAELAPPRVKRVCTEPLRENRFVEAAPGEADARAIVSCGRPTATTVIVDPETLEQRPPGSVGEIWVSGPAVAKGYWNREEETERTFHAYLASSGLHREGPFLRTGDLGFIVDGHVYVAGRLKDLIIIRGQNHHPGDLESTAEESHVLVRASGTAAFAVDGEEGEQLVVVAEVDRRCENAREILDAIRGAIFQKHGVHAHAVVLVGAGHIPRTTSGKIRRGSCRSAFLDRSLEAIETSVVEPGHDRAGGVPGASEADGAAGRRSAREIREWLCNHVAQQRGLSQESIDVTRPLAGYGFDSVSAVQMSERLSSWLGRDVSPTLAYERPTIQALADHLAGESPVPAPEAFTTREDGVAREPIAIVGMGCRFPGANGIEAFWRLLRDGVDAITEVPEERWDVDAFYDSESARAGTANTRWGGFLEDVDKFDAAFFEISPREAIRVDPQQRLLLEVAWETLEDAGLVPRTLKGSRTSVFVGISSSDYGVRHLSQPELVDPYMSTGSALSIAANRISYFFDWRGPSMALDTACSSSLLAILLACRSLWSGESTLALAGGVNLILSPAVTISFSKGGATSPDGRCKPFDSRANGIVRSEGVGLVALKPLSRALADGDRVHALIRGGAVNQDGRTNGIAAPSLEAQERLLTDAYRASGVSPRQVHYVETHGPGTLLGDPIEAKALGAVLSADRPSGATCAIGSVKSNIGHLEAAAGIASVIKVALSLSKGAIPPSIHFQTPNPYIPFDELSLKLQRDLSEWPDYGAALAGVSSFGFGGTNVHIVMEGAPDPLSSAERGETPRGPHLLVMSAKTPAALRALADRYRELLVSNGDDPWLRDLCCAASLRREHHEQRLALVATSAAIGANRLSSFLKGNSARGLTVGRAAAGRHPKLAFVFSGYGGQWWGMGRQLFASEPAFKEAFEECDAFFREHTSSSMIDELAADESSSRLDGANLAVTQMALFCIQVSLAALWRSLGVVPAGIVGHSMGEIAGIQVAGGLSLRDSVRVCFHRARLLQQGLDETTERGSMAFVELSLERARQLSSVHAGRVSIAAHNGPTSVLLTGETESIDELLAELRKREIFGQKVRTPGGGHHPRMARLSKDFEEALAGLALHATRIPYFSTVSGKLAEGADFTPSYWGRNLAGTVLFAEAMDAMRTDGYDLFLEFNAHPVLSTAISQCYSHHHRDVTVLSSLHRRYSDPEAVWNALGALHTFGHPIDWSKVHPGPHGHVSLPNYPWQRERIWTQLEDQGSGTSWPGGTRRRGHPLLSRDLVSAGPSGDRFWETDVDKRVLPYLEDHKVGDVVLLPGTAYLEMALGAARTIFGDGAFALSSVEFRRALFMSGEGGRTAQVVVSVGADGQSSFQIYSGARLRETGRPNTWIFHASGSMRSYRHDDSPVDLSVRDREEIRARCGEGIPGGEFYRRLAAKGLHYGPSFQGVETIWCAAGEALGRVRVPGVVASEVGDYVFHPAVLDACLQVLAGTVDGGGASVTGLPAAIEQVRVYARPPGSLWTHGRLRASANGSSSVKGDVRLFDDEGHLVAEILGFEVRPLEDARDVLDEDPSRWLYEVHWIAGEPGAEQHHSPASAPVGRASWLILNDRRGVATAVGASLSHKGVRCVHVSAAAEYRELSKEHYQLEPSSRAHWRRLLEAAFGAGQPACQAVVHLFGLDDPSVEEPSTSSLRKTIDLGSASFVALLSELTRRDWKVTPRLWLVTSGAQCVGGETTPPRVAQSPLWGLGRTAAVEHADFWGGLIDLDPAASARVSAGLLLREVEGGSDEDQVAFREERRLVARLRRKQSSAEKPRSIVWRQDGSYLITGGLGDLGLSVARWMVKQGARRIILLGRNGLPHRRRWKSVDPGSRLAARIAEVQALESIGATVHVAGVDVSNVAALRSFLARFSKEAWPPIRGVVHAAGIVELETLSEMSHESLSDVLRPKVIGGWLLHRLLKDAPLDFFVLFSSFSAVLGSPRLGHYAAANAFMDSLAHFRRLRGLPALSVNWGAWGETGMAIRFVESGGQPVFGMRAFSPKQALDLLTEQMAEAATQVGVVRIDWEEWKRRYAEFMKSPYLSELASSGTSLDDPDLTRRRALIREMVLAAPPARRRELIEHYLREEVARTLQLPAESLDAEKPLNTLGIDSLAAIELKKQVETSLGVTVPVVALLEGPSVSQLAERVSERVAESPTPGSEPSPVSESPRELLEKIDQLPETRVDELLGEMLRTGPKSEPGQDG